MDTPETTEPMDADRAPDDTDPETGTDIDAEDYPDEYADEFADLDEEFPLPVEPPPGGPGLLAFGMLAALVGAAAIVAVWAVACALIERRLAVMGVGLGFVVAYAIREISRRRSVVTAVIASLLTAVGCVAGGIVADQAILSAQSKVGFWTLLGTVDDDIVESVKFSTNVITWLVYAFAVYTAFTTVLSRRKPEPEPVTDEFAEGEDLDDDGIEDIDDIEDSEAPDDDEESPQSAT